MIESDLLEYTDGWKYRLEKDFHYKLKHDFDPNSTYIRKSPSTGQKYYEITLIDDEWWIIAFAGCSWDGASGPMPDHDFMMAPSLIHDILHWLIALGVISTNKNDLIDKELETAINYFDVSPPKWQGGNLFGLKKWRAKWIRRATNTCDEKLGNHKTSKKLRLFK